MTKENAREAEGLTVLQFAMLHGTPILALDETLLAMDMRAVSRDSTQQVGNGVAVIPMVGAYGPRGVSFFGMQFPAFDTMRNALSRAAADDTVGTIIIDMDSPGGTVEGTPETAAAVRAAASVKPVIAVANTQIASAAYWIASQASEIVASPSARLGSIGVFAAHQDLSKLLEMNGINVTLIRAGKYKAETAPYAPLTDEARAYMQSQADEAYAAFIKDVAAGRKTSQAQVKSGFGEGRSVSAQAAVTAGMADRIGTINDVISGALRGQGPRRPRRAALAFA